jgi:hypothetical protein
MTIRRSSTLCIGYGPAAVLALLTLLAGCPKDTPSPPGGGSAGLAAPSAPVKPPTPPPPLQLGELAQEPMAAVVDKLTRAHYDAQSYGLQQLAFGAEFTLAKSKTKAAATGRWRQGERVPTVEISSITRDNKPEPKPKPTDNESVDAQKWIALRLQLQNLLGGLGRGFLAERLGQWRGLEGKSALRDGKLVLSFSDKEGDTEVQVGKGYVVERVTHRSPKGVTRSMSYTYQLEGGRNLVTRAVFGMQMVPDAEISRLSKKVVRMTDQMVFEIAYVRVAGLLLPSRLTKTMPGDDEKIAIAISYTEPKP